MVSKRRRCSNEAAAANGNQSPGLSWLFCRIILCLCISRGSTKYGVRCMYSYVCTYSKACVWAHRRVYLALPCLALLLKWSSIGRYYRQVLSLASMAAQKPSGQMGGQADRRDRQTACSAVQSTCVDPGCRSSHRRRIERMYYVYPYLGCILVVKSQPTSRPRIHPSLFLVYISALRCALGCWCRVSASSASPSPSLVQYPVPTCTGYLTSSAVPLSCLGTSASKAYSTPAKSICDELILAIIIES